MNKKSYIFCFVVFMVIFMAAYVAGNFIVMDKEKESVKLNEANVNVIDETKTETTSVTNTNISIGGYWIKADENYIVIYNRDGTLVSNTEICIDNFTDSEKKILTEGIYVETAEDLFRYLESYTS